MQQNKLEEEKKNEARDLLKAFLSAPSLSKFAEEKGAIISDGKALSMAKITELEGKVKELGEGFVLTSDHDASEINKLHHDVFLAYFCRAYSNCIVLWDDSIGKLIKHYTPDLLIINPETKAACLFEFTYSGDYRVEAEKRVKYNFLKPVCPVVVCIDIPSHPIRYNECSRVVDSAIGVKADLTHISLLYSTDIFKRTYQLFERTIGYTNMRTSGAGKVSERLNTGISTAFSAASTDFAEAVKRAQYKEKESTFEEIMKLPIEDIEAELVMLSKDAEAPLSESAKEFKRQVEFKKVSRADVQDAIKGAREKMSKSEDYITRDIKHVAPSMYYYTCTDNTIAGELQPPNPEFKLKDVMTISAVVNTLRMEKAFEEVKEIGLMLDQIAVSKIDRDIFESQKWEPLNMKDITDEELLAEWVAAKDNAKRKEELEALERACLAEYIAENHITPEQLADPSKRAYVEKIASIKALKRARRPATTGKPKDKKIGALTIENDGVETKGGRRLKFSFRYEKLDSWVKKSHSLEQKNEKRNARKYAKAVYIMERTKGLKDPIAEKIHEANKALADKYKSYNSPLETPELRGIPIDRELLKFDPISELSTRAEWLSGPAKAPISLESLHVAPATIDDPAAYDIKTQLFYEQDRVSVKVRESRAMVMAYNMSTFMTQLELAQIRRRKYNEISFITGGSPTSFAIVGPGDSIQRKKDGAAYCIYGVTNEPAFLKNYYFGSDKVVQLRKMENGLTAYRIGWYRLNQARITHLKKTVWSFYATASYCLTADTAPDRTLNKGDYYYYIGFFFLLFNAVRTDVNYPLNLMRNLASVALSNYGRLGELITDKANWNIKSVAGAGVVDYMFKTVIAMAGWEKNADDILEEGDDGPQLTNMHFKDMHVSLWNKRIYGPKTLMNVLYPQMLQPKELETKFHGFMTQLRAIVKIVKDGVMIKETDPVRFYGTGHMANTLSGKQSEARTNFRYFLYCVRLYFEKLNPLIMEKALIKINSFDPDNETILDRTNTKATFGKEKWYDAELWKVLAKKTGKKTEKVLTEVVKIANKDYVSNGKEFLPRGKHALTYTEVLLTDIGDKPKAKVEEKIQQGETRLFYEAIILWKIKVAFLERRLSMPFAQLMKNELITKRDKDSQIINNERECLAYLRKYRQDPGTSMAKRISINADLTKFAPSWPCHNDWWFWKYCSTKGLREDLSKCALYFSIFWTHKSVENPEVIRRTLGIYKGKEEEIDPEVKEFDYEVGGWEGFKNIQWSLEAAILSEVAVYISMKNNHILWANTLAHSDDFQGNIIFMTDDGLNSYWVFHQFLLATLGLKVNMKKTMGSKVVEMISKHLINSHPYEPIIKDTAAFEPKGAGRGPEDDTKSVLSRLLGMLRRGAPLCYVYHVQTTIGKMIESLYGVSGSADKPLTYGGSPGCITHLYLSNISMDMHRLYKYGNDEMRRLVTFTSNLSSVAPKSVQLDDESERDGSSEWQKWGLHNWYASHHNGLVNALALNAGGRKGLSTIITTLREEKPYLGLYKPKRDSEAMNYLAVIGTSRGMKDAYADTINTNPINFVTMRVKSVWTWIFSRDYFISSVLPTMKDADKKTMTVRTHDFIFDNINPNPETAAVTSIGSEDKKHISIVENWGTFGDSIEVKGTFEQLTNLIEVAAKNCTVEPLEKLMARSRYVVAELSYSAIAEMKRSRVAPRRGKRRSNLRRCLFTAIEATVRNSPMDICMSQVYPKAFLEDGAVLGNPGAIDRDIRILKEYEGIDFSKVVTDAQAFQTLYRRVSFYSPRASVVTGDYSASLSLIDYIRETITLNFSETSELLPSRPATLQIVEAGGRLWTGSISGVGVHSPQVNALRAAYVYYAMTRGNTETTTKVTVVREFLKNVKISGTSTSALSLLHSLNELDLNRLERLCFTAMAADLEQDDSIITNYIKKIAEYFVLYEQSDLVPQKLPNESTAAYTIRENILTQSRGNLIAHVFTGGQYALIVSSKKRGDRGLFYSPAEVVRELKSGKIPYIAHCTIAPIGDILRILAAINQAIAVPQKENPDGLKVHARIMSRVTVLNNMISCHAGLFIRSGQAAILTRSQIAALPEAELLVYLPFLKIYQSSEWALNKDAVLDSSFSVMRGMIVCKPALELRGVEIRNRKVLRTISRVLPLSAGPVELANVILPKSPWLEQVIKSGILHNRKDARFTEDLFGLFSQLTPKMLTERAHAVTEWAVDTGYVPMDLKEFDAVFEKYDKLADSFSDRPLSLRAVGSVELDMTFIDQLGTSVSAYVAGYQQRERLFDSQFDPKDTTNQARLMFDLVATTARAEIIRRDLQTMIIDLETMLKDKDGEMPYNPGLTISAYTDDIWDFESGWPKSATLKERLRRLTQKKAHASINRLFAGKSTPADIDVCKKIGLCLDMVLVFLTAEMVGVARVHTKVSNIYEGESEGLGVMVKLNTAKNNAELEIEIADKGDLTFKQVRAAAIEVGGIHELADKFEVDRFHDVKREVLIRDIIKGGILHVRLFQDFDVDTLKYLWAKRGASPTTWWSKTLYKWLDP